MEKKDKKKKKEKKRKKVNSRFFYYVWTGEEGMEVYFTKMHEKHRWRSDTFSKVTDFSLQFY